MQRWWTIAGRYDDVSRLLQDLVPWNDTRQLHATIGNVCPDLLAPGAVIDITNLLILDERIDFVSARPHPPPTAYSTHSKWACVAVACASSMKAFDRADSFLARGVGSWEAESMVSR